MLVRLDPAIFSRLDAGDLSGAAALAIRRLIASGLRPRVRLAVGNPEQARRLAVALSFPIREKDATALARRLTRPVLALFAVGDVYVSLCKKSAYAPFSARRRS